MKKIKWFFINGRPKYKVYKDNRVLKRDMDITKDELLYESWFKFKAKKFLNKVKKDDAYYYIYYKWIGYQNL